MTELLQDIRIFNFFWAMGLFFALWYFGVLDILYNRRCGGQHSPRELQMWAYAAFLGVLAALLSMGEIFLTGAPVGWRVFSLWPFLILTTLSAHIGFKRVLEHGRKIARGDCK